MMNELHPDVIALLAHINLVFDAVEAAERQPNNRAVNAFATTVIASFHQIVDA